MPHESAPQVPMYEPNQLENKPAKRVEGVDHVELPTISNTAEGDSELKSKISKEKTRRQVLVDGLRFALGLGAASISEKAEATLEEGEKSKESPKYKKGILEIYNNAVSRKNETAMAYIKDEYTEIWVDAIQESGLKTSIIGGESLRRALNEHPNAKRLDIVHSHPKKMIKDNMKLHSIDDRDANEFRSPPSLEDLFMSYKYNKALKQSSNDFEVNNKAVDHTGVWTFDTSPESTIMSLLEKQNILLAEREVATIKELEELNTEETREALETIEKLRKLDRRLIVDFLDNYYEGFVKNYPQGASDPSYVKLKEVRKELNKNKDYQWITKLQESPYVNRDPSKREEEIEEYVRRCKKIGVTITYEPIENFQE